MSPQNNQEFPNERIIIFVTQFKDSSHIKEYAIGIYLFSELNHSKEKREPKASVELLQFHFLTNLERSASKILDFEVENSLIWNTMKRRYLRAISASKTYSVPNKVRQTRKKEGGEKWTKL